MGNVWLKIKIWTKVLLFSLVTIYAIVFFAKNSERYIKLWVFLNKEYDSSVTMLVLASFLVGVIGTLLVRTTLKTVRQMREARDQGRSERLEREVADMKAKASRLQTRNDSPAAE